MRVPEDVVAITKKGNREIRVLVDEGRAVIYKYVEEGSGKEIEGKYTIAIKTNDGKIKKWMIVPMKSGKELVVSKSEVSSLCVWDKKKGQKVVL